MRHGILEDKREVLGEDSIRFLGNKIISGGPLGAIKVLELK